jgi:hypothetical protein
MDFNEGIVGYGSEEPKEQQQDSDEHLCPSVLEYTTVERQTASVPCTRTAGHPPKHRHKALDGSSIEWED